VRVTLPDADLPGHPLARVTCDECAEGINDHREVVRDGRILCRACAGERYYEALAG
jgi:formylmethanofuran dehydrogenase subunit E